MNVKNPVQRIIPVPVARDKVIAPYYITEELKENLEPEITVISLNCGLPLTYAENVRKLGLILGAEDRAE